MDIMVMTSLQTSERGAGASMWAFPNLSILSSAESHELVSNYANKDPIYSGPSIQVELSLLPARVREFRF